MGFSVTYGSINFLPGDFGVVMLWTGECFGLKRICSPGPDAKRGSIDAGFRETLETFYFIPCEWIFSQFVLEGLGSSVTYGSINFLPGDFGVVDLWSGEVLG